MRIRSDTTEVAKGLRQIGIEIESFRNLSAPDQLLTVVNRLQAIENQSDRTAAAVQIGGDRLGRSLLRLAEEGSQNLAPLIDDLQGITDGTNEAADAAEAWADLLGVLGEVSQSTFNQILSSLTDIVVGGTDRLNAFTRAWVQTFDENRSFLENTWSRAQLATTAFFTRAEIDAKSASQTIKAEFQDTANAAIGQLKKVADAGSKFAAQGLDALTDGTEKSATLIKDRYDQILEGLQAIVDLEEKRRQRNRGGGFGIRGETAERTGQPDPGPSRAQAALNFAVQQKQLRAIERLGTILEEERGSTATFG